MNSRYQIWLEHLFDHEVKDPQWYFDSDAPTFDGSAYEITDLISLTFRRSGKDLSKYRDEQVDQGIWYLINPGGSGFVFALKSEKVSLDQRVEAIGNIYHLYADCYSKRCAETLGHLSEKGSPLNMTCYMFWDIFPLTCFENSPDKAKMGQTVLAVMDQTLSIPHRACQEGALHGLGHMAYEFPSEVGKIIDKFLSQTEVDEKLALYAQHARNADVL